MTTVYREVTELNKIIHEPARLAILTFLKHVDYADFTFLVSIIGISKGNMSLHLAKLEQEGYVNIIKSYKGKIPNTQISITKKGEDALSHYFAILKKLLS